jgi:hypothetical protein
LAARFFDDLSQPVRDRTEKPVPCVNDLVRGVLSTLRGQIASKRRTSRRRIRLNEGRFGAPRDEGQNEEGGPHHSLHRVLHSRESCSTVTDESVPVQYLLPHELAVEFRRAAGSSLDLVQKFPQIHFSIRRGPTVRIMLQVA